MFWTQTTARGSVSPGPLPFVGSVVAEVAADRQIQAATVKSLRISGATDNPTTMLTLTDRHVRFDVVRLDHGDLAVRVEPCVEARYAPCFGMTLRCDLGRRRAGHNCRTGASVFGSRPSDFLVVVDRATRPTEAAWVTGGILDGDSEPAGRMRTPRSIAEPTGFRPSSSSTPFACGGDKDPARSDGLLIQHVPLIRSMPRLRNCPQTKRR